MSNQEEIIEVCGKKVLVRYARTQEEACASCAFCSRKECHDLDCNMRDIIGERVCRYAYFAPAEESPTTIAEEDDARERQRNGLPAYSPVLNRASLDKKIDAFSEAHKGETAEKIEAECRGDETHSLREWAQILATNPDLRAEFDKMCPPQPIQGSIAPEVDLDGEIKKMLNSDYYKRHIKPSPYVIDVINYTARHFAEWGAEHLKR